MAEVTATVPAPTKTGRDLSHLKPYQFKKGHAPCGGRPKGSRDALSILLDAAPLKAKQYVRSTAPAVLVDARKWIMPIEEDTSVGGSSLVIAIAGLDELPNPQTPLTIPQPVDILPRLENVINPSPTIT